MIKVRFCDYNKYINIYSDELVECLKNGLIIDTEQVNTVGSLVHFIHDTLSRYGSFVDASFPGLDSIRMKSSNTSEILILDEKSHTPLSLFIEKYGNDNTLTLYIHLLIGGLGEAFYEKGKLLGVKFIFHSNEGKHKGSPHVHVIDRNRDSEFSFNLIDKKEYPISKKPKERFNAKKKKRAIEYIKKNIIFFQNEWNKCTDGFIVEIDI